jgi:hypothetical protein
LLQPIPLEAVNVALRRLLNLHFEAVFEVVKRAVRPGYSVSLSGFVETRDIRERSRP